jgi:hypothetical protein
MGTRNLNQRIRFKRDIITKEVSYASVRTIIANIMTTDTVTENHASSTTTVSASSTSVIYTTLFVAQSSADVITPSTTVFAQAAAAKGLSTGAKAGIGVGAAAIVIGSILVGILLYYWSVRGKMVHAPTYQAPVEMPTETLRYKSELGADTDSGGWDHRVYMESRPVARTELQ